MIFFYHLLVINIVLLLIGVLGFGAVKAVYFGGLIVIVLFRKHALLFYVKIVFIIETIKSNPLCGNNIK